MKIKSHLIALLLFPSFLAASQPPNTQDTKFILGIQSAPSQVTFNLPEVGRLADALEKASDATKIASRNLASIPQSAGIYALLTMGGVCATMCVYYGIQKLEKSKNMGLGLIAGGVVAFLSLIHI